MQGRQRAQLLWIHVSKKDTTVHLVTSTTYHMVRAYVCQINLVHRRACTHEPDGAKDKGYMADFRKYLESS